jgi:hypothetical protein
MQEQGGTHAHAAPNKVPRALVLAEAGVNKHISPRQIAAPIPAHQYYVRLLSDPCRRPSLVRVPPPAGL